MTITKCDMISNNKQGYNNNINCNNNNNYYNKIASKYLGCDIIIISLGNINNQMVKKLQLECQKMLTFVNK